MNPINIIKWYIKWWWVVGIAWVVSLLFLVFMGFGIIGNILSFLNMTIPNGLIKNIISIIYFPMFLLSPILKELDIGGPVGYLILFGNFLIPCAILAIIFKLILWRTHK